MRADLKYNKDTKKYEIIHNGKAINRFKSKYYSVYVLMNNTRIRALGITELLDHETGQVIDGFRKFRDLVPDEQKSYLGAVKVCSKVRHRINVILTPQMKRLAKLYSLTFGVPSCRFNVIKDVMYFQGGWPCETTPAKLQELCFNFGEVCMAYAYLDRLDEVNVYLEEYGFTVDFKDNHYETSKYIKDNSDNIEEFYEIWNYAFKDEKVPTTNVEIAKKLLDTAVELQGVICGESDKINVDAGHAVEHKYGISIPCFSQTVKKEAIKIERSASELESGDFTRETKNMTDCENILDSFEGTIQDKSKTRQQLKKI